MENISLTLLRFLTLIKQMFMVKFLQFSFKTLQFSVICVFLLNQQSFSQILKLGAQITVSTGGRVYDVENIPEMNAYVVVGDFDSINGVARNNIALIDKTTYAVKNNAPFTPAGLNVDGIIRSVEYLVTRNGFDIIIGGNFITINGNYHQGLAIINKNTGPVTPTSNFSLYYFDYATGFNTGVYDLATIGDTLLIGGDIDGIDLTSGTDNSCYEPGDVNGTAFIALSPSNTAARYSVIPNSLTTPITSGFVYSIDARGNEIEIATSSSYVQERNKNFIVNTSIDVYPGTNSHYYSSLMRLNDSTVAYTDRQGGVGVEYLLLYSTNDLPNNFPSPVSNWQIQSPSSYDINGYIEYNNDLIVLNYYSSVKNVVERFEFLGETSPGKVSLNKVGPEFSMLPLYSAVYPQDDTLNNFFIAENKLFLSTRAMTSMDGLSRKGMAIFCLEPQNPSPFTVFDTTVCAGNTNIYTIPQAEYATGYRWSYTGTGASYRVAGTANVFQPLSNAIISNINANSIEVKFTQPMTSGVLSVSPFATCNTTTDYLFADSISLNLTLATPPNLSLVSDTMAFTCLNDSLNLVVQSTNPGATYSWEYNNVNVSNNDSLLLTLSSGTLDSTYYYAFVTEPVNGCQAMDSVLVYYDTMATPINIADIVSTPLVFDCNTNSLTVSSTTPNATINWALQSNPNNLISNTFTIYDSYDSTDIIMYATYNASGCTAQQQYTIAVDNATLPGTLIGYSNYGAIPQDTVSCLTPNLTLVCDVASGTGTAQWLISGTLSGDSLNLSQADTVGMNTFNTNVYKFVTTNTSNGCNDTINTTIKFDFDAPYVSTYNGPSSINCSASDLTLIHNLTGGSVTEGWLNNLNVQTFNDTLLVDTIGEYFYEVTSTANGCTATDTVNIIKTNELLLNVPNDSLVCDGQSVNLSVSPINNIQNTSYVWSTGDTTQTISAIGGIDSIVSVIATNDSGCIGYDTVKLLIPSPIYASFLTTAGCSNGNIQVSTVYGGTGSYEYSLDQVNWQTSPTFANLSFGTHTIYVRDGLGCIFGFNENLSSSSNSLAVNFLASTYNLEDDTVAIVNISDFNGFDSLVWILPDSGIVYSYADSMVVMSVAGGGWYDITLIGYQDTCSYTLTKSVYFGALSPQFDNDHTLMGIQSYVVYPNPTTGNFSIDLAFGTTQNYSILITNMQGQPIPGMSVTGIGDVVTESFSFPNGLPTGTYVIHIISDFDAERTTIILN